MYVSENYSIAANRILLLLLNMGYFMTSQGETENSIFILNFKQKMVDGNSLTKSIL